MPSLALLFLAAELPEPDLDQLAEAAEKRFLWDPCGEYALAITETNDISVATTTIQATATARLEGDRWTITGSALTDPGNGASMVNTSAEDQIYPFVLPLLGVLDADGLGADGRSLMQDALELVRQDTDVRTPALEVYEGRDHYRLDVLLGRGWSLWRGREENTAAVVVDPSTSRAREWRLDVRDPTKLEIGHLVYLNAVLKVDPSGRPVSETLHTRARLGPFGLNVDRAITYTRTGDCH